MNILLIVIFILLLIVCFFCYQCYQLLSAMQKTKVIEKSQIQSVPSTAEQGNENPIKAPERFSIKTFFEFSKAESIIYNYLKTSLSKLYTVIPHVSLTDIFSYCKPDGETDPYNMYKLLGYHVDFVIFDELYYPIMAIELNGASHKTNAKTIWTDQKKKEFFEYFHVPLVVLDLSQSYTDSELVRLFIEQMNQAPRIVYCWKCRKPILHPFTECPQCHKIGIPVPALLSK